jgi:hypothetical protein
MNAIYVAHDRESGSPVLAVADFKDIQRALDHYCGVDIGDAKLIKFHPYVSQYASTYVGHYEYLCSHRDTPHTSIFHIYCVGFYKNNM